MEFYQKKPEDIFSELKSSKRGLSYREALRRLKQTGLNKIKHVKKTPVIFKFLAQFKDLLVLILLIAAGIALVLDEPRDALIIGSIILLNAIIGFIQEYKAERILAAFKKHLPSYARVIRDGRPITVFASTLVPGDILILEEGDRISADARLFEAYGLKVDEFSLTGESQPRHKETSTIESIKTLADLDNMVFMGTLVTEGDGKAIVVKTGMDTEFGTIAQNSQKITEELTPLQKELAHVGKTVGKIALVVSVFTLILFRLLGKDFHESLLFTIAAATAVVPEGLPAAMSVALSLGAQRMLRKKALVKKLLHVETLGSVTTICTDKTGTLTTGKMSVCQVVTNKIDLLLENMVLCNSADLNQEIGGDPLEKALLVYGQGEGMDVKKK